MWYQCYHSTKYPVINFVHIDNAIEMSNDSVKNTTFQDAPNANSTMIEQAQNQGSGHINTSVDNSQNVFGHLNSQSGGCQSAECSSYSVGHTSHIPRTPPTAVTYSIPVINKSTRIEKNYENIFGMIKLGDNDVCYTSGTIEWVGRKRSFPINTGFKTLSQSNSQMKEPVVKKVKKLNKTFTSGVNKTKECECADVLPTVNAIVDHLNALHEAVDLVDLRLNTVEDVITKNS